METPQSQTNDNNCQHRRGYSRGEALINNAPYVGMLVLGAALFVVGSLNSTWGWLLAGAYLLYGIAGALWIMIFLCPYCHFWNSTGCPCGYGLIAAKLRGKKSNDYFKKMFKRHIPVIVPLWFIPVLAGGFCVLTSFSWLLLVLLILFAVDAFVVLPLFSRKHGCVNCPQKHSCPWMAGKSGGEE